MSTTLFPTKLFHSACQWSAARLAVISPSARFMRNKMARILTIGLTLGASSSFGAIITWSGGDLINLNTNWSSTLNWSGGVVPTGTSDVKFFDVGGVATAASINNIVDITTTVGSLQYGNTNFNHTTFINSGATLSITNTGGLFVGTPTTASPATQLVNATVTGAGALVVSNRTGFLVVNQGASSVGTERATLDLTGLNTFSNTVKNIFVGSTGNGSGTTPAGNGVGETGTLFLGKTNVITVVYAPATANYPTNVMAFQAGISIGYNGAASAGGTSFLYLGQTNMFNVDSLSVGQTKGLASMLFGPAFTNNNPTAVFRGTNGGTTRVSYWAVGDTGTRGGSGSGRGTNDFTYGTLDAMVNLLTLGQDTWAGSGAPGDTASAAAIGSYGVFNFPKGVLDVNTLTLGNVQSTVVANTLPCLGVMNVGSNATLRINTVLQMPFTQTNGAGASSQFTYGNLNVTNGTVFANSITVGTYATSANNRINLTNATLVVSNALATSANPLTNYSSANSLLGLTITSDSATKVFVGTLTTGGSTNVVQINPTPVLFGSYPAQFALVKYSSLAGSGYNFGLTNAPVWAPGAYLSNNVANKSIDLVLPTDPRPSSTAPAGYSGPIANVTFSVMPSGVSPLTYQWRKGGGNNSDGATGNGSTYVGTTTASLGITNAQSADNGNYDLVITNAYGSFTSVVAVLTVSAGDVAPSITGPNNATVIQSNNATLTATVSGVPAPAVQWQKTGVDISGATNSSLTISNAQYPADQATYSIIATNVAGAATNSAVLTVIVPPVINVQPVSLTVTNTQAAVFSVTATGVPAPTYQWKKNNSIITGATNSTLNFASAVAADIATYSVVLQNAAGSVTSSNATLTVNSTMIITTLSPSNNATGLCYDTPLYITFSQTPLTRNAGKIRVYNVTNSTTPVDTLDMSLNTPLTQIGTGIPSYTVNVQSRTIAGAGYATFPVIITGNKAAIYPHSGVMTSNQTYYVTIDNGVFTDTNGAYFAGITTTNTWQFATKPAGPAAGTNYVVVSPDGTADFCTVQGAVDFLPNLTTTTSSNRVIFLRKGNCVEIVNIPVGKNNITIRGESRQESLLSYPNSNIINPSSHQVMVLHVRANDIAIENLKLTNSVPQGGSQSFALMVETGAKRFICNNADVDSYQDTILVNTADNTAYFYNSLIQGDVDFIWGGGNCFFTNCELRELRTGGIYLQPRGPAGSNGMSFVRCNLTRLNGTNASGSNFTNCLFARALGNTNSSAALIYCNIDTNVVQTGWTASEIADPGLALRWWEFGNSNLNGTLPVAYNGIQLTNNDPRLLAARDSTVWLNGWVPQLAPNILTNPANQYVATGGTATLGVTATGIPEPAYQWLKNGTNVPGATSATLSIPGAVVADSGTYSVIVSNSAGSVTSSTATLTVNTAPVANNVPASTTVNTPLLLLAAKVLLYASDADSNPLTLTSVSATSTNGGTASLSLGTITYTPAANFIGLDQFNYTVSDGLGSTATSTVTVTVTTSGVGFNQLSVQVVGPDVVLTYLGIPAFNYALDRSFNLTPPVTWVPQITNPAAGNGYITFTNTPDPSTNNFWRTRYVP